MHTGGSVSILNPEQDKDSLSETLLLEKTKKRISACTVSTQYFALHLVPFDATKEQDTIELYSTNGKFLSQVTYTHNYCPGSTDMQIIDSYGLLAVSKTEIKNVSSGTGNLETTETICQEVSCDFFNVHTGRIIYSHVFPGAHAETTNKGECFLRLHLEGKNGMNACLFMNCCPGRPTEIDYVHWSSDAYELIEEKVRAKSKQLQANIKF